VETIKQEGKTVLMTTHYMEEASILCDEIAVVDHGRVIAQGKPDQLLSEHFPRALVRLPRHVMPDSTQLPPGFETEHRHVVTATDDIDATLVELNRLRVPLDDLHISTPTLDDLFLKLTGHGLRES
jgi:ABC-2 type transport system ATP-binding protein